MPGDTHHNNQNERIQNQQPTVEEAIEEVEDKRKKSDSNDGGKDKGCPGAKRPLLAHEGEAARANKKPKPEGGGQQCNSNVAIERKVGGKDEADAQKIRERKGQKKYH